MIPSGNWQAAKSIEEFTLGSYCVGPEFDFEDFEFLRNTNHIS